ncbi:hypothetical protein LTR10_000395 [Elasticomyces elasticus]|nr:hypothetical protein LTR10_000395 [Elasticomyces elasticus]
MRSHYLQQYPPKPHHIKQNKRGPDGPHPSNAEQGKAFLTQLFTQFDEAKRRRNEEGGRHRFETNPWLEHTGWERHIGGHKQFVRQSIRSVVNVQDAINHPAGPEANTTEADDTDSERALQEACTATVVLIRRSFDVCRPEIVGRAALEYVNRGEAGEPNSDRPFHGKQMVKTLQKYADRWVKMLRYLWRTAEKGEDERPNYRMTQRQQGAVKCLKEAAHRTANGTEEPEAEQASVVDTGPSRRRCDR